MVRARVTRLVHAPLKRVVEYFTNPDSYFKVHSKYYKSFRVVSQSRDEVIVDEEWDFGRGRSRLTHKITLDLPRSMTMEVIRGDGVGSSETITFQEVPAGTVVTYCARFRFGGIAGRIFGWFARGHILRVVEEMADEDQRYLEGSQAV